jgi:ABC-type protease/lipase transport system fused ATPase/permease subunit
MKERGTTLVLISHRPQIMAAMDKILVMEAGSVLRLEAPPQVNQISQGGAAAGEGAGQMTQVSVPGAAVTAGSVTRPRSKFLAV